ncbi:chemotaxis protein CheW [Vibrio sp. SCSIO 43136]|uniref:chemotaxis protein CheW n=1 Tax=Vibrio sp. SCSIO 43136 TaxID=2819101 RepID=UPI002074E049|nr:chemotaxis protein CheW [Vibrio sp. SCSIO 43136]USD67484.1 purine-binding chemotaxis protein CheW [Vibrio sp. SCSIO 43136]
MALNEFLSFILEEEEYAVPILDVREVRGWSKVRPVPNSPGFLKGVLEIRGEYVPIVDLRVRFNMTPAVINATTVVIVLNDKNAEPLGIIVDAVSEVYALDPEEIRHAPNMSHTLSDNYIDGIATVKESHIILINLETLFDVSELNQLSVSEALS